MLDVNSTMEDFAIIGSARGACQPALDWFLNPDRKDLLFIKCIDESSEVGALDVWLKWCILNIYEDLSSPLRLFVIRRLKSTSAFQVFTNSPNITSEEDAILLVRMANKKAILREFNEGRLERVKNA